MTESINWGSVADWVSGLGSLAAVVTALYLSNASQRIRLSAYAGHRIAMGGGAPDIDLLVVSATNVGSRATVVRSVGLRVGLFKKRHALVMLFAASPFSAGLPKALADGETAQWSTEMGPNFEWVRKLTKDFITSRWEIETFRFVLHTSNGGEHLVKPDPALKKHMIQALAGTLAE